MITHHWRRYPTTLSTLKSIFPLGNSMRDLIERTAISHAQRDAGTWLQVNGERSCFSHYFDRLDTPDGRHWHRVSK